MERKPIISIVHLAKSFGDKEVLKDINLDIYPGEVVSIIGSSGSGKSTLLRCINRLEEASSGQILFNDIDILDRKTNINKLRENIPDIVQILAVVASFSSGKSVFKKVNRLEIKIKNHFIVIIILILMIFLVVVGFILYIKLKK